MKKVLLASTALLLTAGFASAQSIELSGSANGGLKYNSGLFTDELQDLDPDYEVDEVTVHNEVNMVIAGSGATDTGLQFGAFIDIDEDSVDDAEVFISGVFGTVTVGNVDPATDGFGIADVGYDGIGIDDVAEQYKNADAFADVHYAYSAAGLTFTATYGWEGVTDDAIAVAVEYEAAGFSGGIGYADATTSTVTAQAGYSQGPLSINGMYSDWDAGGEGYGIDISYDVAGATITGVWASANGVAADPEDGVGDAYGVGFAVPLGGGLTVAGGVGIIETDFEFEDGTAGDGSKTVADLGLTMSF